MHFLKACVCNAKVAACAYARAWSSNIATVVNLVATVYRVVDVLQEVVVAVLDRYTHIER